MERKFSDWNVFGVPRSTDDLTLFQAVENWLDRERDQLPLWLPVGTGFGIAIWQFGGPCQRREQYAVAFVMDQRTV